MRRDFIVQPLHIYTIIRILYIFNREEEKFYYEINTWSVVVLHDNTYLLMPQGGNIAILRIFRIYAKCVESSTYEKHAKKAVHTSLRTF